eukprot:COSAG06_NODE_70448_length_192_cov_18.516129_1_plen_55_part_10
MQTKVLFGPPGSLLWRCLFSWQRNGKSSIRGFFDYNPLCTSMLDIDNDMDATLRC